MCVCFLLQQRPHRASSNGQREWGGRMFLAGYVKHDLVLMHHRHYKKKNVNKLELKPEKLPQIDPVFTATKWWGRLGVEFQSVPPQTGWTGSEHKLHVLHSQGHFQSVCIRLNSAEIHLQTHFSDTRHSSSRFCSHTLVEKKNTTAINCPFKRTYLTWLI